RLGTHRQGTDRPEGTFHGEPDPLGAWIWWFDDHRGNEFGQWVREPFTGGACQPAAPELSPGYSAGIALGQQLAVLGTSTDGHTAIHLLRPGRPATVLYVHHEVAWVQALSKDEALIAIGHSEHGDSRHPAVQILDT